MVGMVVRLVIMLVMVVSAHGGNVLVQVVLVIGDGDGCVWCGWSRS